MGEKRNDRAARRQNANNDDSRWLSQEAERERETVGGPPTIAMNLATWMNKQKGVNMRLVEVFLIHREPPATSNTSKNARQISGRQDQARRLAYLSLLEAAACVPHTSGSIHSYLFLSRPSVPFLSA